MDWLIWFGFRSLLVVADVYGGVVLAGFVCVVLLRLVGVGWCLRFAFLVRVVCCFLFVTSVLVALGSLILVLYLLVIVVNCGFLFLVAVVNGMYLLGFSFVCWDCGCLFLGCWFAVCYCLGCVGLDWCIWLYSCGCLADFVALFCLMSVL